VTHAELGHATSNATTEVSLLIQEFNYYL